MFAIYDLSVRAFKYLIKLSKKMFEDSYHYMRDLFELMEVKAEVCDTNFDFEKKYLKADIYK